MTIRRDLVVGVDLGGTKVLSLVATEDGLVLGEDTRPSLAERNPAAVLDQVVDSANSAMERAGVSHGEVLALGVSSPGPVDRARGVVTTPPNFAAWRDVPLVSLVGERLGLRVAIENDGNAGALGELRFGAGRGARDLVYVGLGTGFGAGIIAGGRLYGGATGAGGELGHTVVNAIGRMCNCGNRGCIEAYCSGVALRARGQQLLAAGLAPVLRPLAQRRGLDAALVFEAAAAGDRDCVALISETAMYFGAALASFVNALSPERIVVGGSMAQAWETLVVPAVEEMRRRAFHYLVARVEVVPGELGARACALGAVALALGGADAGQVA